MSKIRSRKHRSSVHLLALLAASIPVAATAQEEATLRPVTVKENADVPYKADTSANFKYTQPLLDTPKTITIIKKEVLEEQGAATLMEALRNTPGITMQMGENGNTSAGDTFQMRGQSVQQSIFVDGIRDLGAVTRDIFNVEQVEVVKGAGGSEAGRSTGVGYINLISKQAHLGDDTSMSGTVGTADKKRVTADLNRQLSEDSAFRMNVMAQDSGVDGRNVVKNTGQGISAAFNKGLNTPTRLSVFGQAMHQDNIPDGGIPTIGMPGYNYRFGTALTSTSATALTGAGGVNPTGGYNTAYPAVQNAIANGARVNGSNFYGSNSDYEKVDAEMVTAKIEHDLDENTTVRNITRFGRSRMDRVLTGVNSGSGQASSATSNIGGSIYSLGSTPSTNPATWYVGTTRQGVNQVNTIVTNQTSLNTKFNAMGVQHSLATGVELTREEQENVGFTSGATTYVSLYNPDPSSARPGPQVTSSATSTSSTATASASNKTAGNTTTLGLYVFDQAKINEQYALNGGVRVDRYKLATHNLTATANPNSTSSVFSPVALYDNRSLWSWNLGGVYKPAPNGSVYVSYADAQTPPGGDTYQLSATTTSSSNAIFSPQTTRTAEVGTKWELMDKKLNVAAALFRSINEGQISYDLGSSTPIQSGKKQVQGLELSAVGQMTRSWQVMGGIAMMSAKQLSQNSCSGTTTVTCTTSSVIGYTPDLTATLWTSYQLNKFNFGLGARYVSEQKRNDGKLVDSAIGVATTSMPTIPSYSVYDAMVTYQVDRNTNVRLNVYNLFDKDYIQQLNNEGTRMILGTPRSGSVTLAYKF